MQEMLLRGVMTRGGVKVSMNAVIAQLPAGAFPQLIKSESVLCFALTPFLEM